MKYGTVYWITGLSGAGKTTLGSRLYSDFKKKKNDIVRLDGDELREIISNLDYSYEGRKGIAYQYARFCKMLTNQGIDVVICTVSMYDDLRAWNRENISNYCEIYVKVPMEDLIERDQKQLYSRALRQEISNVMGVDVKFEEPKNPDIVIENGNARDREAVYQELVSKIKNYGQGKEEQI